MTSIAPQRTTSARRDGALTKIASPMRVLRRTDGISRLMRLSPRARPRVRETVFRPMLLIHDLTAVRPLIRTSSS